MRVLKSLRWAIRVVLICSILIVAIVYFNVHKQYPDAAILTIVKDTFGLAVIVLLVLIGITTFVIAYKMNNKS